MFEKVPLLLGFPELGQVVKFELHLVTIMTGICLAWVELSTI